MPINIQNCFSDLFIQYTAVDAPSARLWVQLLPQLSFCGVFGLVSRSLCLWPEGYRFECHAQQSSHTFLGVSLTPSSPYAQPPSLAAACTVHASPIHVFIGFVRESDACACLSCGKLASSQSLPCLVQPVLGSKLTVTVHWINSSGKQMMVPGKWRKCGEMLPLKILALFPVWGPKLAISLIPAL